MKKALLFHPEEELNLVRLQKKILSILNEEMVTVFPFFPVFCPLENDFFNQMQFSDLYAFFKENLIFCNTGKVCSDEKGVFVPLELSFSEEKHYCFAVFLALFSPECDIDSVKEKLNCGLADNSDENLPLNTNHNIKRVRLSQYDSSGFVTDFYDEKWLKIQRT